MATYRKESDVDCRISYLSVHGGKGQIGVKRFFFAADKSPIQFLTFYIPPFASEGVHAHHQSDKLGRLDEFYYIVRGIGRIRVGERIIDVKEGDHVFVPAGEAHGIENASEEIDLKVLLTYIGGAPTER